MLYQCSTGRRGVLYQVRDAVALNIHIFVESKFHQQKGFED
jgi:hypothetical protein